MAFSWIHEDAVKLCPSDGHILDWEAVIVQLPNLISHFIEITILQ